MHQFLKVNYVPGPSFPIMSCLNTCRNSTPVTEVRCCGQVASGWDIDEVLWAGGQWVGQVRNYGQGASWGAPTSLRSDVGPWDPAADCF